MPDGSDRPINCLVPLSSFDEKAADLWAVQDDPKVGVGDGGWNESDAVGHSDRQNNNEHCGGDRVLLYFANLHSLDSNCDIQSRKDLHRNATSVS